MGDGAGGVGGLCSAALQKFGEQVVTGIQTGTACRAPTAEASGMYVLKVSSGQRSVLQKFVVLK
ncbi:MAG TPA: hypothetical protein VGL38_08470 [bacterium]